jgi:hypothetical protein
METAAVVAVHCVLARTSAGRATGGLMVMESIGADAPVALSAERACAAFSKGSGRRGLRRPFGAKGSLFPKQGTHWDNPERDQMSPRF